VSIIGSCIINNLASTNIQIRKCNKTIIGLGGKIDSLSCVDLEVDLTSSKRIHNFILLPSVIKYVLLGRDFIGSEDIGIFIGKGGYTIGSYPSDFTPFSNSTDITSLLHTDSNRNTDPDTIIEQRLEDFVLDLESERQDDHIPASILFSWLEEIDEWHDKKYEPEENLEQLLPDNEFFLIPVELEDDKKQALRELMTKHRDMFTSKPGLCTLFKHRIDTGDALPIKSKTFPMSHGKKKAFDETFDELEALGIIEPSSSPWSSNAFVIEKPDGSYRFLVNYKPLNAITKLDSYPVPSIENMLAHFGRSKVFTTVDGTKGFFQIEIEEKDREKTAFRSHKGLYQFKRMAMGLVNGPPTYQRLVDIILKGIMYVFVMAFFDDNNIYSESFDDHINHLDEVFTRFKEAGLTFHPKKIQLCRRRLKFLGFIIEPGKISPDPEKVRRVNEYPVPRDITELRRFLGYLSYYRKFIEKFAVLASPLYKLTSSKVEYTWSDECQTGFVALKQALCDFTQVYIPDLEREFIITCDASRIAVAAILS